MRAYGWRTSRTESTFTAWYTHWDTQTGERGNVIFISVSLAQGLATWRRIKIKVPMAFLLKGIVHAKKMKMLSSFTRPHVFPNLYECLCYFEHKIRYFTKKVGNQTVDGNHDHKGKNMEVINCHKHSKYLKVNYPFKRERKWHKVVFH